ncbi:hypothetical protein [Cellulosimicrobium arenosum]|uniref:Uncharacterized protein n=1 Tax=Cellulosimicrobium arenosum TaxID=2708133 RepID=A0A927IYH2_9MICO|nr:hypothetical protein [Cellulosimicrobium arenosum]MBD8077468.1 hypothetical protein [Cellulosimicrobium arenosum]
MSNETGAVHDPEVVPAGAGQGPPDTEGAPTGEPDASNPQSTPTDPDEPTRAPVPSPFVGMPVSDFVRDGAAVLLLLVSLTHMWSLDGLASSKVDVVLITILSLFSLALPYVARVGVLPATWTVHTTRRARLVANAPYLVLVVVYLLIDVLSGIDLLGTRGGLGPAVALGLAGAVLAAQPRQCELGPEDQDREVGERWLRSLFVLGGVLAVGVLLTVVLTLVESSDAGVSVVLAVLLQAALVVALVGLPLLGTIKRAESARLTLASLGLLVAVAFALSFAILMESTHAGNFGLVLVPAFGAVAASPAVRRAMAVEPPAVSWTGVAVRSLDLVVVVAGFVALSGVVSLVAGFHGATVILSIILGLVAAGVALVARLALARDAASGRLLAIGLAGAAALLGIVLLVVSGGGVVHLLLAFGLPLLVVYALTVPREVRDHFAETRPGDSATAGVPSGAYEWSPPAPRPARTPDTGGYGPTSYGPPAQQPQPWAGAGQDATQVIGVQTIEPQRSGYAARPGLAHDGGPATAVLPPYSGEQPTAPGQSAQEPDPYAPSQGQQAPGQYAQQGNAQQDPAAQQGYPVAGTQQGYGQQGNGQQAYAPAQPVGFTAQQALDPSTPLEVLAQIVQDAPHLRPQVAANPSTYPALLDWLGNLGDPAVDAALRSRRG